VKTNPILEHLTHLDELEALYHQDPATFKVDFLQAWSDKPDSPVLAVWYERLRFQEFVTPLVHEKKHRPIQIDRNLITMGILAVLSGLIGRLVFPMITQGRLTPLNLVYLVFAALSALFLFKRSSKPIQWIPIVFLLIITGIFLNMLPLQERDSVLLSYLHLPVFLWTLLGWSFSGNDHQKQEKRVDYIKFNVDFALTYGAMALGGMVVTGLTLSLFSFIGMDVSEFYFENVVLFGAVGLTVVAAFLASNNVGFSEKVIGPLAKIFSPLILSTLIVYLAFVLSTGRNPFIDRSFLLTFNGILLFVLAVTLLLIVEDEPHGEKKWFDYVHFGLITTALVIDVIALSSILFRLSSYGITPNRLAVFGLNTVVLVHLGWICLSYWNFLRNRSHRTSIRSAVTRYLPIYGLWAAMVAFGFPLLFP
jgi:hypothetical protein